MTQRPDPCHYDRARQERVTKRHRTDCTARDCAGCVPCTAPHCPICGRGHLDNNHPHTCPSCVTSIRQDLTDIDAAHHGLRIQAQTGSSAAGRLLAMAPIPGGDAQVLTGPTVRLDVMRTYPKYERDHRPKDPIPPLAVLAEWEDRWRTWLNLAPAGRADLSRTCRFLRDTVIPHVAQDDPQAGGPDLPEMAAAIRRLRDQLERALHDEREPDRGVGCFDCDATLVRRYHRPRRCSCPPRPVLRHAVHGRCDCATGDRWQASTHPDGTPYVVTVRHADPDDGHIHERPDLACIACHRIAEWEAVHAGHNQGGLTDPTVGTSWECPGCRRIYTPGEYQTAVRAELARENGGWITIPVAAQAAQEVAGRPVTDKTIRGWVTRDWVVSRFELDRRGIPGPRLVRWADVRREAERLGAGRNQCTHLTPARQWVRTLEGYGLEVWEDEEDACREPCDRCSEAIAATLRMARRSGVA